MNYVYRPRTSGRLAVSVLTVRGIHQTRRLAEARRERLGNIAAVSTASLWSIAWCAARRSSFTTRSRSTSTTGRPVRRPTGRDAGDEAAETGGQRASERGWRWDRRGAGPHLDQIASFAHWFYSPTDSAATEHCSAAGPILNSDAL